MTRGRKPKPTALRVLQGNPGRRPLPKSEPKPLARAPTAPEHLDDAARLEWDRLTPQLVRLGLLTELDRALLAGYCSAYSLWVHARGELRRELESAGGPFSATEAGYLQASPWFRIAQNAAKEMRAFAVEFGLSPSSRTRTTAAQILADDDPAEELLGG
jgi:P27 family predicted phage terminase small subunit